MRLFIMRHGEAEPYNTSDEARNLTIYGRSQAQQAGIWLKQEYDQIDMALVSPFVRAKQTLESIQQFVDVGRVEINTDITPCGNPSLVHDYVDVLLNEHSDVKSLLLVAHMPIVSFLLDEFCKSNQAALFGTASIFSVDYDVSISRGMPGSIFFPD
ncbi:phosphohistidine phosphatase SixA [Alteromonas sp. a30]|uniref:phosphohistidine phosphatase SixA n=1 Tax=Alteromonas sp. a30 TaxID=2730917 RepID=UPI002281D4EE|nr:phosphohistidine phosphatase SixA [Alteromonas sp. a30]MCY7295861.1 phosphohistidine phosphatase SixA [Alteromonas sp. a30]